MHVPSSFLSGFLRAVRQTELDSASPLCRRSASPCCLVARRSRTLRPPLGARAPRTGLGAGARQGCTVPERCRFAARSLTPSQTRPRGRRRARPRAPRSGPATGAAPRCPPSRRGPAAHPAPGAPGRAAPFCAVPGASALASAPALEALQAPHSRGRPRPALPAQPHPSPWPRSCSPYGQAPPHPGAARLAAAALRRGRGIQPSRPAGQAAQPPGQRRRTPGSGPREVSRLPFRLGLDRTGPRPRSILARSAPSTCARPPGLSARREPRSRARGRAREAGPDGAAGPGGTPGWLRRGAHMCPRRRPGARCRAGGRVYRQVLMAPRVSQPEGGRGFFPQFRANTFISLGNLTSPWSWIHYRGLISALLQLSVVKAAARSVNSDMCTRGGVGGPAGAGRACERSLSSAGSPHRPRRSAAGGGGGRSPPGLPSRARSARTPPRGPRRSPGGSAAAGHEVPGVLAWPIAPPAPWERVVPARRRPCPARWPLPRRGHGRCPGRPR